MGQVVLDLEEFKESHIQNSPYPMPDGTLRFHRSKTEIEHFLLTILEYHESSLLCPVQGGDGSFLRLRHLLLTHPMLF